MVCRCRPCVVLCSGLLPTIANCLLHTTNALHLLTIVQRSGFARLFVLKPIYYRIRLQWNCHLELGAAMDDNRLRSGMNLRVMEIETQEFDFTIQVPNTAGNSVVACTWSRSSHCKGAS